MSASGTARTLFDSERDAQSFIIKKIARMAAVASTSSGTSAQDLDFQAETFRRLHPRAYLERFLAEGFRPDGREVGDWRDVSVNVGVYSTYCVVALSMTTLQGSISTADGSSLVRLGDTTIVCGVKAEIAEPDLDSPGNGFIGS